MDIEYNLDILILEDSEFDAELIIRSLRKSDISFEHRLATNRAEFEQAMSFKKPDVILSDFNLQDYNGKAALELSRKIDPAVPFIVLSGSLTRFMEINLLEKGANDILNKDNLSRLPFAITRAFKERRDRAKLKENLKMQEALAEISINFNTQDEFDVKMNSALRIIGETADVSRVYVFEDYDNGRYAKNTYEWCSEGVEPQIHHLQDLSYEEDVPYWNTVMKQRGKIFSEDIRRLPEKLREILEAQDIKALIVYPILIEGEQVGFVGFDEIRSTRSWSMYVDRMLKTVSGIFANAYKEKHAAEALNIKNRELESALGENKVLLSEVHHRVKNNLALISSFLEMEKFREHNEEVYRILDDNLLRIKSLAIVQEMIYKSNSLLNVDALQIINQLFRNIYGTEADGTSDFDLLTSSSSVVLNVNQAVPLVLLISEIYSYLLHLKKSANKPEELSTSGIKVYEDDELFSLSISDNDLCRLLKPLSSIGELSEVAEVLVSQLDADISCLDDEAVLRIRFPRMTVKGSSANRNIKV